jgi:TPR repeat protein
VKKIFRVSIGLLMLSTFAFADYYEDGLEAYINGKYERAVELFQESCDSEDPFGCSNLALMYEYGQNVKQDYSKAVKLHEKACEYEVSISCNNLALMYINGQGVKQNIKKALEYFDKTCKSGNQNGCNNYSKYNE